MKKISFLLMLIIACFQLASGQNVITCTGSKTGAKVTYLSNTNGEVKVKVDWDEGSTFAPQNLEITNGTCTTCAYVGGIGKNNSVQTWTIKQTDLKQPIAFAWGTASTKKYCGSSSMVVFDESAYFRMQTQFRGNGESLESNGKESTVKKGNSFMDNAKNVTGQMWKAVPVGDGYYRLQTKLHGTANSLEGNQSSATYMNGAAFMDQTKNVTGQLWKITPLGNGYYRLTNKFRGEGESLEGNQMTSTYKDGAAFMSKTANVTGQYWKFVKF